MNREELLAKIIEFAAMAFNKDAATIIENDFDVMIPVARFGKFETIGDLVDFVMDEM